ncbi:MAG: alpha/beta hydrolase-fold protein [Planctomycetota bacterium]
MTGSEHVARRDPTAFAGRVELPVLESRALCGNPLGDPHVREVPVYIPPDAAPNEALHVVFVLAGFTGRGHALLESHPWKRGFVRAWDRDVARGAAPRALLVLPDCFTRYGGSQYVNSSATGRYEDYVAEELVPFIDARYATTGQRAVCGKSSGGFGALHLALQRPGLFQAVASISGDCCFEYPFANELLVAARGLSLLGGDPRRFLARFEESYDLSGDAHALLNVIAMSACYAPNPASPWGFDLPMDVETGERREDVWERWLAFDPLRAVATRTEALRALRLLHLEAGTKDEFHLQLGLRRLTRELTRLGVPHDHVEHDGGHFGLDSRYHVALPRLIHALGA